MADYVTKAQVVLTVNGKQAENILKGLEKDAEKLREKMDSAAKIGDKDTVKKLRRELQQLDKQINQIKGTSQSVEHVLTNMDKATPKELNKALSKLKKELNGIERGSEAWTQHMEKIRALKAEINSLNEEMSEQQTLWEKIKGWIEDFELELTGAIAVITGFILAARKAVNAYADMEQEMANVRKYTGMTEAQVAELNERFKEMDTRTSREDLNKLAQEAGRLGKTSVEDVLGFVKAADKINVALDDLGDGATLTLSKLTGIFGDEERLGTEKALLSVGSVINELSQNCAASAPYIAEFTSRMGGVGAQAGMTVQQIMAYAAVLDSNEQKLESSATALSQMIIRIYQDPAKYAKAAGMDVENFTKLVKEDMNAALLEFLAALKNAGGMDVLSPMLKEMGENGQGVSSTFSILAKEIEQVKRQQEAANVAFEEAISIDQEFEVQNSTIQAGFDKARKSISELSVELGEKLRPAMSMVISSSTMTLKALSTMVDFIIKHKVEIITVTAALAAYNAVLLLNATRTTIATKATLLFNSAVKYMSGIVPALKLMFAAAANSIQYFTNGLRVNYQMQLRWQTAMAGMKLANWTGLIISAAAAIFLLARRFTELSEVEKDFQEIRNNAVKSAEAEISKTQTLVDAAKDENRELEERQRLVKLLNETIPDYNAQIDATTGKYTASTKALEEYNKQLVRQYEIEGAQEKLKEIGRQKAEVRSELSKAEKAYESAKAFQQSGGGRIYTSSFGSVGNTAQDNVVSLKLNVKVKQSELDDIVKREKAILDEYGEDIRNKLVQEVLEATENASNDDFQGSAGSSSDSGSSKDLSSDRFKKEKEWREKEEALARIAYSTGEDLYSEYTQRMNEIAEEYYSKILEREDLSESERLKYQADYWDAVNKLTVTGNQLLREKEEAHFQALKDKLRENLIDVYRQHNASQKDREKAEKIYQDAMELAQLEHLQKMVSYYEKGSKEYLDAQRKSNEAELAAAKRKFQQMQELQEAEKKKQVENEKKIQSLPGGSPIQSSVSASINKAKISYDKERKALDDALNEGLISLDEYDIRLLRIKNTLRNGIIGALKDLKSEWASMTSEMIDGWMEFAKALEDPNSNPLDLLGKAISSSVALMTAVTSQLTSFIQADMQIQTAKIEERYDKEIKRAEGNSYIVAKLEKEKEEKIAKAKKEASRKTFALQVIQAVAQTAANAIQAFGAGMQAGFPMALWLAPALAAMAAAQGAVQIAVIKKQQQASGAQGFSKGGFTKKGRVDEPAGIVHAGEWVASQDLVNNPKVIPILEALEYAQKHHVEPQLSMADVEMRMEAPAKMAQAYRYYVDRNINDLENRDQIRFSEKSSGSGNMADRDQKIGNVIEKLNRRLEEPFVTIATIAGDKGIEREKRRYDRLIKNKG